MKANNLPKEINIVGIIYKIEYVDKASDVDIEKRQALWGQIDYWTRTIRVYIKDRTIEDVWVTIIHEILHGLSNQLHLNLEDKGTEDEDNNETNLVDMLSYSLFDTFKRNGLLKI